MKKILLVVIFLLASFFRLWQIGDNPAGFFTDEASNGINAYKIATTAHDDHGRFMPVLFQANGDWRDPVYIYSLVPSVALFGLSEFSVRLVSALYGIGGVILMYFLGKQLQGEKLGLISAFILAISPWHIHFSRVGFQLIAAVFWVIFMTLFLYKSLQKKKYYPVAALGIIFAFFSYSTTKLYIFPLLIFFFLSNLKESFKLIKTYNFWIVNIVSIALVLSLSWPYLQDGTFFTRWNQVNPQHEPAKIMQSYMNHFSYEFLFSKGDAEFEGQDVKRHSIIGMGELHYFQIIFLIIGIAAIIFKKKLWGTYDYFLFFLFLYPLGSIFTQVQPQATRSILGIIPFTLISSLGFSTVQESIRYSHSRIIINILCVLVSVVSIYLLFINLRAAPFRSADYWGWQYGYRPVMNYFKKHADSYDDLIITHRFNAGEDMLDFYNIEYNCEKCKIMDNPISIDFTRKQLFAVRRDDLNDSKTRYPDIIFNTHERIKLPNNKVELYIGEFVTN